MAVIDGHTAQISLSNSKNLHCAVAFDPSAVFDLNPHRQRTIIRNKSPVVNRVPE